MAVHFWGETLNFVGEYERTTRKAADYTKTICTSSSDADNRPRKIDSLRDE